MPKKGYKQSIEHRGVNKGKIPWNKGVKLDRNKYPNAGHTQKHNEETRKKMSKKAMGRKFSAERNKKISEAMKKRVISKETLKKYSEAREGAKSHFWKGGVAFEAYSIDWTRTLKRSIRERDKYVCRLCGKVQDDKAHAIHHIDYDKKNNNPINLITLCNSCHSKTSYDRDKYIEIFNQLTK